MPPPNFHEQNIDRQSVCQHVASAKYAELYQKAWGIPINCSLNPATSSAPDVDNPPESQVDISFKRIILAVCAWQHSKDLNSFSSKRDFAMRAELACACQEPSSSADYPGDEACSAVTETPDPSVCTDPKYLTSKGKFPLVGFTDQENLGHALFYNTMVNPFILALPPGAFPDPTLPPVTCSACHTDHPGFVRGQRIGDSDDGTELLQLYADDAYHNIGTPTNPEVPADPDPGLCGHTDPATDTTPRCVTTSQPGFFKTPTLRNVDKRKGAGFIKAYTHNGWFKSVESIVHFYNTSFLGNCVVTATEDCTGPGEIPYQNTTAATFGVTRCLPGNVPRTEIYALAHNCWPTPEWPATVIGNRAVGNMHMTAAQEAAVVAYLKTLTDTETAKAEPPYK